MGFPEHLHRWTVPKLFSEKHHFSFEKVYKFENFCYLCVVGITLPRNRMVNTKNTKTMKTSINKYAGKISNLNKEINRIEKEMLVVRRSDEYEDLKIQKIIKLIDMKSCAESLAEICELHIRLEQELLSNEAYTEMSERLLKHFGDEK